MSDVHSLIAALHEKAIRRRSRALGAAQDEVATIDEIEVLCLWLERVRRDRDPRSTGARIFASDVRTILGRLALERVARAVEEYVEEQIEWLEALP